MAISSFTPPSRLLMGPGPSDVHPRVLAALEQVLDAMGADIETGAAAAAEEEKALPAG